MKPSRTPLNQDSRIGCWIRLLFVLLAAAILPSKVSARNASYTLCAPQYTGVPFTYLPPAVDATFVTNFHGNTDLDTGWTGAFRYVLWNGTTLPDGAFQINQDQTKKYIYLSFQVNNDPTFDGEDSVIVAFDPDGTLANMQRLIIHPVVAGVGDTSPTGAILAGQIEYWKGYVSGTGWQNATTDPAFVTAVAQSAGAGPYIWDVQVRIDNSVLGLPASPTNFGIYVNLIRIDSSTMPNTDTQFTFPASTPLKVLIPGDEVVLEGDSLPDASNWGTGSLATSCSGVNISPDDITGSHGLTISLNDFNQFSVVIHNSGPRDALQVFPTFQIANYGLPSPDDWARPGEVFSNLIPKDPLPTDPSPPTVTVAASGGTATVPTGMWRPGTNHASDGSTPLDEHDYYAATPDTCIRVLLTSLAPDTIFSVRSTYQNFETGNTSEFKHTAIVSTKGYRLPKGAANHEFNLTVTRDYTPACVEPKLIAKYPNLRYSEFKNVVHGCRISGDYVVIKKKKFADCQDVGSFGYNLRHEGPVKGFTDNLAGEGLQKRGNGYHLVVGPGKNAVLTTTVVSQGGRCGETNKRQAGATAAGVFLIGLLTFLQNKKRRG